MIWPVIPVPVLLPFIRAELDPDMIISGVTVARNAFAAVKLTVTPSFK